MGRLRGFGSAAAIVCLLGIWGCGGHPPAGTSPYPSRINLNPAASISLQLGGTLTFTASAQNGTGNNVGVGFTYNSSDTSTLTIAPNGLACAGQWDSTFTICTPGGVGVVQVTASALGIHSPPTYVFVHPAIDSITVNGIQVGNHVIQEPCLSQGQTMTLEAHAFSQGADITSSVGPFLWSANNFSVVALTPIITDFTHNVATNQATAKAVTPGITQIFATASGVTSNSFRQPLYGPTFDFFETCPIQNISLFLGPTGSLPTGQTTFVASKGTSQNVTAVVTDVMGNTSQQGANTPVQLTKIPLSWIASRPSVVTAPSTCQLTCGLTTPSPGAGSVTATCSPPACNIGYPQAPAVLTSLACAQFVQLASCRQFIPLPVYAATPISGIVTGATAATSVLTTSSGCAFVNPLNCSTGIYNLSSSKSVAGSVSLLPSSPTSLLFDLGGDKAFMGSEVGAVTINPANLGTANNAFASLGPVTGKVLASSNNGNLAVFSDTTLTPQQVFIANQSGTGAGVTALSIQGATTAAFSPDGLKAFIFGFDGSGRPNLYVYSTLRALQTIPLPLNTTVNAITFSTDGAFVYVVEPSLGGGSAAFTVYNMCDNAVATGPSPGFVPQSVPLAAAPVSFKALPDGVHFVALESGGAIDYIAASVTEIPPATPSQPATSSCPMHVTHTVQPVSLSQGTLHPIDFFTSADGTLLYVVASDRSLVLVHNFLTGGTTGIELADNALPVKASMSSDAGTIVIAGNDGKVHEVSTALGGNDLVQTPFPNLPNYLNSFCTDPAGNCTLDLMAVRP